MTLSFLVDRRELQLGAQDTVTGWYAKTFIETVDYDKMVIAPKGTYLTIGPVGTYAKYTKTGLICAPLAEGDEIIANGTYHRVGIVDEVPLGNSHMWYTCELNEIQIEGDQPSISGIWHLDSDSLRTDPRNRLKTLYDLYKNAITEDDNLTVATTLTQFANPDYGLKRIFKEKHVDVIYSFDKAKATPKQDYKRKIYAFKESVPITIAAINKVGITATNLIEKAEQDLRRVITDYGIVGAIREIESVDHKPVDLGPDKMWSTTVTINYERANDDYVPTTPAFSHGIAWTYDGDKLSGGKEGTWTLTTGGSTLTSGITSDGNMLFSIAIFAGTAYYQNGTNLGIDTNLCPYLRVRYKTSGAAQAAIVATYSDATVWTVMTERSALTYWKTEVFPLLAGKTLDHIALCAAIGTGDVYYDFVQVYAGMYILPNMTKMQPPLLSSDVPLSMPGRLGSVDQTFGTNSAEVTMTCDIDMEHSDLTWKRPQTIAPPKNDYNNTDVLYETLHNCAGGRDWLSQNIQYPWVWLDLGDPDWQFKARLIEVEADYAQEGQLRLKWREARTNPATNDNIVDRFGLNL
jgi:hypothetical protein